jgi:hypothetical protein
MRLVTLGVLAFIALWLYGSLNGYSHTFEVGVKNYDDQKICGLPNGEGMKFKIPNPVYVKLANGQDRYFSEDVLINDTIAGEPFEVKGGCVTMSPSRSQVFRNSPNSQIQEPQWFRIKFYK